VSFFHEWQSSENVRDLSSWAFVAKNLLHGVDVRRTSGLAMVLKKKQSHFFR
jgi:hypothetical protein